MEGRVALPANREYVFSEGGTVPPKAGQWSMAESFHGQFRPTSWANLTVPPHETLNTCNRDPIGRKDSLIR